MGAQLNIQPVIDPMEPVNTAVPTVVAPLGASALMAQPAPMTVVAPPPGGVAAHVCTAAPLPAPAPTLARQE